MNHDRRSILTTALAGSLAASVSPAAAATSARSRPGAKPASELVAMFGPHSRPDDPAETIRLWPEGAAPMARTSTAPLADQVAAQPAENGFVPRYMASVAQPRLDVFRPAQPNGAAVVISPGGGYRQIVIDTEGYETARWLAARGFTVFVLFYRLPAGSWTLGPDAPLADAQRAIRLVRHRATQYGIDPARVCFIGFSAGGHVCSSIGARFAVKVYDAVDAADALSARPFCVAPMYPVVSMDPAIAHAGSRRLLLGESPTPDLELAYSPERTVAADAPPHFMAHAEDDGSVKVDNTLRLRAALKAAGIPVETHLFAIGGHGFGLRRAAGKPCAQWPELWLTWARSLHLV